jgi:hypothetical protein
MKYRKTTCLASISTKSSGVSSLAKVAIAIEHVVL